MNKKIFFVALAAIIIVAACSPKTAPKATATAPATTATTATAPTTAPKAGPVDPTDVQLTAAKTKYPDVTIDVLKKGYSIYTGACTRCHGAKNIEKRDETQWVGIMESMAPKANLTPEERDAVWKYIMSVKLAAAK